MRRSWAALSQLQEKTAAGRLAAEVAHEREKAAQEQAQAAQIRTNNRWLVIGLISAGGVLVFVLLTLAPRRREPVMQPVALGAASAVPLISATPEANAAPTTTDSWQQRALEAEQKVEQAHAAIRAGVMAQLKEKLVSNLASNEKKCSPPSSQPLRSWRIGSALNELHAPLQERLRVYETRMADLEKALAAKGEENRELIKAKIEMTRKQLETETRQE